MEVSHESAADADPLALPDLFRLDGRRALVVGGYGGIGRIVCDAFAAYGAELAVAGRSLEKAERAAAELTSAGSRAVAVEVDLRDRASCQRAPDAAAAQLGGLDIVVNLGGIDLEAPATEFSEEDWRRVIETNLDGAFWLSQAAGRIMISAGRGGRIIHFSSTRGAYGGRRGFVAYGASKAGLNMVIRQLATEWGQHGITVNGIAPGFVPTKLVAQAAGEGQFTAMLLRRIPLGRFGQPIEMAGVALFLASPAASFITGQIIYADGGVTASS
jgi:NAD(P)-dependent dehydrogenase (short-subunit alcohol dehydrogenase family)